MTGFGAAADDIAVACARESDPRALRARVLARLRRVIPYDAHVWLLTDPVTRVGTSPMAAVPGLEWDQLPALIRERYLCDEWTRFSTPAATDIATTVFTDPYGSWAWLDLWRIGSVFSDAEHTFLLSLAPVVAAGLRHCQARTFDGPAVTDLPAPAVIVFDRDLRVVGQTTAAGRALGELNPSHDGQAGAIPAAAYNVAAALLAAEAGKWQRSTWSRVHLAGTRWLTLSADHVDDAGTIAVTLEPSTPAQRREVYALAHGLSARERQVLDEVVAGADSRAIAASLSISEHTANDHIKAIFAKTGAPSRTVVLARIAG